MLDDFLFFFFFLRGPNSSNSASVFPTAVEMNETSHSIKVGVFSRGGKTKKRLKMGLENPGWVLIERGNNQVK